MPIGRKPIEAYSSFGPVVVVGDEEQKARARLAGAGAGFSDERPGVSVPTRLGHGVHVLEPGDAAAETELGDGDGRSLAVEHPEAVLLPESPFPPVVLGELVELLR